MDAHACVPLVSTGDARGAMAALGAVPPARKQERVCVLQEHRQVVLSLLHCPKDAYLVAMSPSC